MTGSCVLRETILSKGLPKGRPRLVRAFTARSSIYPSLIYLYLSPSIPHTVPPRYPLALTPCHVFSRWLMRSSLSRGVQVDMKVGGAVVELMMRSPPPGKGHLKVMVPIG